MFTVSWRHGHSDWQSTEPCVVCYRKVEYNVNVLTFKKKNTVSNVPQYTHYRNTYQQGN